MSVQVVSPRVRGGFWFVLLCAVAAPAAAQTADNVAVVINEASAE